MPRLLKIILLTAALAAVSISESRVFFPQSMSEFYEIVEQYPFAVVHILDTQKDDDTPNLLSMKIAIRSLSRTKDFERSGIAFVGINVRDIPDIQRIVPIEDHSSVVLYDHGLLIKDDQGRDAQLNGFADEDDIENFIERYLGEAIDEEIAFYREGKRAVYSAPRVVVRNPGFKTWYGYDGYGAEGYYTPGSAYHYYGYTGSPYYWGTYYPNYYRRWWWPPTIGFGLGFGGRYGGIGFGFGL